MLDDDDDDGELRSAQYLPAVVSLRCRQEIRAAFVSAPRRTDCRRSARSVTNTNATSTPTIEVYSWRRGVVASVVRRINEVTVHWARLVLGWVTVSGRVYHHGV